MRRFLVLGFLLAAGQLHAGPSKNEKLALELREKVGQEAEKAYQDAVAEHQKIQTQFAALQKELTTQTTEVGSQLHGMGTEIEENKAQFDKHAANVEGKLTALDTKISNWEGKLSGQLGGMNQVSMDAWSTALKGHLNPTRKGAAQEAAKIDGTIDHHMAEFQDAANKLRDKPNPALSKEKQDAAASKAYEKFTNLGAHSADLRTKTWAQIQADPQLKAIADSMEGFDDVVKARDAANAQEEAQIDAAIQAVGNMKLLDDFRSLGDDVDGMQAQLEIMELRYDQTVMGAYVRSKTLGLLGSSQFCEAVKNASQPNATCGQGAFKKDLFASGINGGDDFKNEVGNSLKDSSPHRNNGAKAGTSPSKPAAKPFAPGKNGATPVQ